MRKVIFSEEDTEKIIKMYLDNYMSMDKIGKEFGVSKSVISRILTEQKISIRDHPNIYKADYRKFEVIDDCEKAYWLGFLAADGNVFIRKDQSNATVSINLHTKDKEHLEKFKIFMNSNVPIKDSICNVGFSNNTPMSRIAFNSKPMAADLIDKNVVCKKSLILKPPKIDSCFYMSYIKGYFDGDGSIYKSKCYNNFGLSFVGTKELLEWIKEQLNWDAPLFKRKSDSPLNTFNIRCGGTNKPYNLMKQFYESSKTSLNRKLAIYNQLATVVHSRNTM